MPRVLVLNANTTTAITDMVARVLNVQSADIEWRPSTARFGAAYVASEAAYSIAQHAALDAYARDGEGCDAVLIACFGDPGLFALREIARVPVVGLADASLAEASTYGRYAIVTGGAAWKTMLQRFAGALGRTEELVSIRTVAPTGAEIAADPHRAMTLLADACKACVAEDGAQAVILGGAGLAGLAERIQSEVSVPVIDSVLAGGRAVRAALAAPRAAGARAAQAPSAGLSQALADLLARR
jgi:Asp/Glu/hydantoin racemase